MRKFFTIVRMELIDCLTYRADIFLYTFGGIFLPLVTLLVWLALIASGGRPPFSASEISVYYALVLLVKIWTSVWAGVFIAHDIRYGELSRYLLKPVSFLFFQIPNNLAEKFFKTLFALPVVLVLIILFNIDFTFVTLPNLLLFIVTILFAAALNFLINICGGLAAFWMSETQSLRDGIDFLSMIFSGSIIPLAALPLTFQKFNLWLPFRYTLSFPIEIIQNKLMFTDIVIGLLFQIGWLFFVYYLFKHLWEKGIVLYSAYGT